MPQTEKQAIARELRVIRRRVMRYSQSSGVRLNPLVEVVESALRRMAERKVREGEFYCPEREATGDRDLDRRIACPCEFHLREIAEDGRCRCGLFVKSEKSGAG